jgi:phosphate:Na+ symporter
MPYLDTWKFLTGLGFFLYGMSQLEAVLKNMSGRPIKLFLKRHTQGLFKSIFGGAILTGIVQSSSVVSLIVLAFVESGIITFRNAMGVILGTNLGTTLGTWVIASVGFKLNLLNYTLPIIAITTIGLFLSENRKKLHNLFLVFFALGILFLGLSFMQDGALELVTQINLESFTHYNPIVFVILGFVVTTIIQSSSATVVITLTAIYTGTISFPAAAAVVIGAEIGTTIKILLWGMTGSSDKKRVGFGNFWYNIFTSLLAYVFLYWIIYFIEHIVKIKDPLIKLVFFQSAVNLFAILLFIPFLNIFSKWLEGKFISDKVNGHSYINKNLSVLPLLATDTFHNEALNLLHKTRAFIKKSLFCERPLSQGLLENIKAFTQTDINNELEYQRIKQSEGDLLAYYLTIRKNNLDQDEAAFLLQNVSGIRQVVFAAKAIKDIQHNLIDFNDSANDILYHQCEIIQNQWIVFNSQLSKLLKLHDNATLALEIETAVNNAIKQEEVQKGEVIGMLKKNLLNEVEASTLMNVNREFLSCGKSLLLAIGNIATVNNTKPIQT